MHHSHDSFTNRVALFIGIFVLMALAYITAIAGAFYAGHELQSLWGHQEQPPYVAVVILVLLLGVISALVDGRARR